MEDKSDICHLLPLGESMSHFFGRKTELQNLIEQREKRTASFIVVKGRRRIGKSRLIK